MSPTPPPPTRPEYRACFLVGATATGKTAVAQALAERDGREILSTDSMLVYRGLDIGTAKPTRAERARVVYHGLDLAAPRESFSVADYLDGVARSLRRTGPAEPVIAAGGTGLYVRCLIEGLDPAGPPDPAARRRWETRLARDGITALQSVLKHRWPAWFAALDDPGNPRRLVRALEQAETGRPPPERRPGDGGPVLAGLRMARDTLRNRIAARIDRMLAGGLDEETRRAFGDAPPAGTAAQAIGYREMHAVLAGKMSRDEARERMLSRTVRLARRQMTWFRHQARVEWIDIDNDTPLADIMQAVHRVWKRTGPVPLRLPGSP